MEEIRPGYTRVSDIIKPWNDFSGIPLEVLERKKNIGTEVHKAIQAFNECIPVQYEGDGEEYFTSFLKWMRETKVNVKYSELRLYDDTLKITGGIDALVQFPNEGNLVLVDWKTTASYTKKTARMWELQGTFYHYLLTKNGNEDLSDRIVFVQLNPDGKLPKIREFVYSPDTMALCAAAVELYHFCNP